MRVVVVGGGVAGLATARGLLLAGHDVLVLERSPAPRATGGALTLWSNGLAVLDEFGVDLTGVGREIDTFEAWRADGRLVWRVDVRAIRQRLGRGAMTVPRQRLVDRLAQSLPSNVVDFGCDVVHVDDDAVHCAGGRVVEGDVVIGADGRRSLVRNRVGLDAATPTGWATWQGLLETDHPIAAGAVGVNVIGLGGVAGFLPAGEGLLQWWFEVPCSPSEKMPSAPVEMLRSRFRSWRAPVSDVLDRITDAEVFPHWRHSVTRVWGAARTTLVGDAAHVMPPALAQGANQSLEDAWVIARVLSNGDVAASLRRYESLRRRRVAVVSRLALLATTQQGKPWTRITGLPTRPTTWLCGTGLRASSRLLTTRGSDRPV